MQARSKVSIIAIVAVTSFMGTFLISAVNISLPAIEAQFEMNAIALSWVITSFLLSNAMFLLPAGRWADLTGVKRMFKLGVLLFALFSIASGLSPSGWWLIFFRFLQGAGAALTSTTGPAILVSAFPQSSRGKVLGISVSAVYLGLASGPFIGGMLTQLYGWRSVFYVASLLGVLSSMLAFLFLGKDEPNARLKKIDLRGTVLFMSGLVALIYGASNLPQSWWIMILGVLALIGFWLLEARSKFPVIDTRLFTQNRLFTFSNLASLINYSATFAIVFLLSIYLQKIKALSPSEAGTILVSQPIMMALFSPLAGRLSDRIQPRFLTTIGMVICTLGLIGFAFVNASTPVWLIVVNLLWLGSGFGLFSSPNMNTIMSAVNRSQYGLASGTAATGRVIGQIVSMTVVAVLFSMTIGNQILKNIDDQQFIDIIRTGFIIFSVMNLFGIYFSYYRGQVQRD
ncbi:MAG: MFS transporter [Bacteroidales bacterium]|jgi:EmrB/QacA subfamily drug resistance transporter|nr:MFS transporter [Bacteroidales bacterium]MDY0085394.1 MFS transporter [Bacteroidales bacterium]